MAVAYDPAKFTDVDGQPIDDAMAGWVVFIALHLDEDEWFTDDELVEDALLALGYQDGDQRETLARDGSDHLLGVKAALDRLVGARLVQQRRASSAEHGEPKNEYALIKRRVDELREVSIAIGSIWGAVGTDTIDTKAEFGWLVLIALRIHHADRAFGMKKRPDQELLAHELGSLLAADLETVHAVMDALDDQAFIEWDKGVRFTSRDAGYEIDTANGWGGVYSLRDRLIEAFGDEPLRDTDGDSMAGAYDPAKFTDVDGQLVGDVMANWVVFIALHLDEDEWFTDDELVEDALLALGYQDGDQRETLARDGSDHLLGVKAALDRLVGAGLVQQRRASSVERDEPKNEYELVKRRTDDLREVSVAIGSIWGAVGADTIDTKAEFGWLVLIALRIHHADRAFGMKKRPDQQLLAHEIESLLAADLETVDAVMDALDDRAFIEWDKGLRFTSRDAGYEIDAANGWGGVYSLRDRLIEAFGDEPLHGMEPSMTTESDRAHMSLGANLIEEPDLPDATDLAWAMLEIVREFGTSGVDLGTIYDQVSSRYNLAQIRKIDREEAGVDESPYEELMRFARVALQYPTQAIQIVRSWDATHDYSEHRCYLAIRGNKVTKKELGYVIEQNMSQWEHERQDIIKPADRRYDSIPSIAEMTNAIVQIFEQGSEMTGSARTTEEINHWLVRKFNLEPTVTSLKSLRSWDDSPTEFLRRASAACLHLISQGRLQDVDGIARSRDRAESEHQWAYLDSPVVGDLPTGEKFLFDDHQEWAWATLEEIRDQSHQSIIVEVSGARISTKFASRKGLSSIGRAVRSRAPSNNREYVIRCIVMCELLAEMGLTIPTAEHRAWRLTVSGQHITYEEFSQGYEDALQNLDNLGGEYGWYRGDLTLEKEMQAEETKKIDDQVGEHAFGHVPDVIDLCYEVLRALAGAPIEHQGYLPEADLLADVAKSLPHISRSYREIPAPPWIRSKEKKKQNHRSRPATFFEYRLEHVLRALSTCQVALIHADDPYTVDDDEGWAISEKGREIVATDDTIAKSTLKALVNDYFETHVYEDWHTEEWMIEFIAHAECIQTVQGISGGDWFELLCCDILRTEIGIISDADIEPIPSNDDLDDQGIDIIVPFRATGSIKKIESRLGSQATIRGDDRDLLLVQCKRELSKETDNQATGKLFGFGARLRSHAWRGEVAYGVLGGLLITLGDLSCEAEWSYWATRAAWQSWDDELATAHEEDHGVRQQNLRFELWDGGKVLRLMKERQIGVITDHMSESQLDGSYFESLFKRTCEKKNKQPPTVEEISSLFEKTGERSGEIREYMKERVQGISRTRSGGERRWRAARQR